MVRASHPQARSQLLQARRLVAAAIAEEECLHQRYDEHRTLVERWHRRAALAVSKGMDDLAKQALLRHRHFQALAGAYWSAYEEQLRLVIQMKQDLQALEVGRPLVSTWRAGIVPEMPAPASARGPARDAEIARALLQLEADPVADRLAALEREDRLDRQLAELKARLA